MTVKNNRKDSMSIRIEEELKKEFSTFCENSGMTVSGAVNLLVKNTIKKQQIPFQVTSTNKIKSAYEGGKPQVLRASIRIEEDVRKEFAKICDEIGVSMSRIIKMFMLNCINTGKLPF